MFYRDSNKTLTLIARYDYFSLKILLKYLYKLKRHMGWTGPLASSVLNVHLAGLIYITVFIITIIYDPCVLAYYLIIAQFIASKPLLPSKRRKLYMYRSLIFQICEIDVVNNEL